MALALQREPTAYCSLLPRARAVLADPELMPARLVRGCIALGFTACLLAVACSHRLADAVNEIFSDTRTSEKLTPQKGVRCGRHNNTFASSLYLIKLQKLFKALLHPMTRATDDLWQRSITAGACAH